MNFVNFVIAIAVAMQATAAVAGAEYYDATHDGEVARDVERTTLARVQSGAFTGSIRADFEEFFTVAIEECV